ncbi:MAG: hypothetical protein ABSF77_13705 [Spirochaetia bacterium]|jgi:hypothetical protein
MNVKFKDLIIGNTDARSEVNLKSPKSIENFRSVFIQPDGFDVDDFLTGKRVFVYGLKGIGKTAVLLFVAAKAQETKQVEFIYFRSELSEEDRTYFNVLTMYKIENKDIASFQDFELLWQWFLMRKFGEINQNKRLFQDNDNLRRFNKHLFSVDVDKTKDGIRKLIPRITGGKVALNIKDIVKAQLDFVVEAKEGNRIEFSELVDVCKRHFLRLVPTRPVSLFVDELELTKLDEQRFTRDSALVRDLIVSVKKMNQKFIELQWPINIICAVRSEVLKSVGFMGKEILKDFEDIGLHLNWHRYDKTKINHPLSKLLISKIRLSEVTKHGGSDDHDIQIWKRYFPETLYGKKTVHYILNSTWYRPRDIIRILRRAKEAAANETYFDERVFDLIRKDYSKFAWIEMREELNVKYSAHDLDAIERILLGFQAHFNFNQFKSRVDHMSIHNLRIKRLAEVWSLEDVLGKLYEVGALGNYYQSMNEKRQYVLMGRFAFRGDDVLLVEEEMMVHPALRPYFSLLH